MNVVTQDLGCYSIQKLAMRHCLQLEFVNRDYPVFLRPLDYIHEAR